jgi:hypothetical protein
MRLEFETGAKTKNFRLSSGPAYTLHGDFFNTWVQADLERLTRDCIRRDVDCGTFDEAERNVTRRTLPSDFLLRG